MASPTPSPLLPAGSQGSAAGELGRLQAQAVKAAPSPPPAQACLASLAMRQSAVKDQERTEIELKLVQALALGSRVEYRRWLTTYSRTLARECPSC